MGFVLSTHGFEKLINTAIPNTGYAGIKAAIIVGSGTLTEEQFMDAQFMNNIVGVSGENEAASSGGYTAGFAGRIPITGVTITKDTGVGTNFLKILATAPVVNTVAASSGTWRRILYYFTATNDTDSVVLGTDTPSSPLTPNGGNITLPALEIRLTDTSA